MVTVLTTVAVSVAIVLFVALGLIVDQRCIHRTGQTSLDFGALSA